MEMGVANVFSLHEAGFLTGQSTAAINRAIDRKEIGAARAALTTNGARRIDRAQLRALAVIGAFAKDLTPAGRRKVSAAVRRLPTHEHRVELGPLVLRFDDIDLRIDERLARLEALRKLVEPQEDGDPLIRGTRSSVYAVAAFTKGMTTEDIMQDCHGLSPELIQAAVAYADIYPRAGRPLPTRSLKRVLMDMGASGVWDVDDEDDDETLVA